MTKEGKIQPAPRSEQALQSRRTFRLIPILKAVSYQSISLAPGIWSFDFTRSWRASKSPLHALISSTDFNRIFSACCGTSDQAIHYRSFPRTCWRKWETEEAAIVSEWNLILLFSVRFRAGTGWRCALRQVFTKAAKAPTKSATNSRQGNPMKMVRIAGLEPARVAPLPPQSSVSANSTICAQNQP